MRWKSTQLWQWLTCNWKQELCTTETFRNRFFDSNRRRKSPSVIPYLLSSPRHPILHSNIFFYVNLLTKIILSWNSLKCILWYLLELSDPFIKNQNSVLPILIEKNWTTNLPLPLKMRSIFSKEGKFNFFDQTWTKISENIFSTSCKNFKIFPSILFEKRRLAQGIRRPKVADSPLVQDSGIQNNGFNRNSSVYRSFRGRWSWN